MPLIPLDECGNIDPVADNCGTLFDIGEAILVAALAGLEPYAPAQDSPCYPGIGTYVSIDAPPADHCDLLAVYLSSYGPTATSLNLATRSAGQGIAPTMEAHWGVELWEAAYPNVSTEGERFVLPDPDVLHTVNAYVYRHGLAMYSSVLNGYFAGTLLNACTKVLFGPLAPIAPQGGCVGWTFTVTTGVG